jgi:carbon-monoxide dehydrogenase iron sulfur subunit
MKVIADIEKCTGCNCCELICHFNKSHIFSPEKSRIKVVHFDYLGISNPVLCIQCNDPRCVEGCPSQALIKQENGMIKLIEDRCTGCRNCVTECIIGAINFDKEEKLPLICDACDGDPACVKWCPSGALRIIQTATERKSKEVAYTISRSKALLKKAEIPEKNLDWYRKFA